jgi:hypothetical protein
MFRLLKLAFYFAIGYCIYELYQGFTQGTGGGQRAFGGQGSSRSDLNRALNSDEGRPYNLSGPGVGQQVDVEDASGGRSNRVVGRGVTTS